MTSAVEVVIERLDVAPDVAEEFDRALPAVERARARRYAFERDRRRFVVGRGRLRRLLAARLDVRPEEVELVSGPRGKPGLPAGSGLTFNMARSGEVAVYAFSRDREIGVDVEELRDLPDADTIATRFFSRREVAAYLALNPSDKTAGFFNCWTRKEAFVKALGDGLHHPLDGFDVSLAPDEPARLLRVGDLPGETCGWSLETFSPGPGFVGAVVLECSAVESLLKIAQP